MAAFFVCKLFVKHLTKHIKRYTIYIILQKSERGYTMSNAVSLKEVYKDYFKVGAAVNNRCLDRDKDIILKHFNTVTCEYEMKLAGLRRPDLTFDFANADKIYNFANENGIEVRGHNLVWHQGIYTDVLESMTKQQLIELMTEHMRTVGERYKKVVCWDVVNEAISDDWNGFLRDTVWRRKLGDDYYMTMFRLAREIIPDKTLVYNDFNEYEEPKRNNIIKLVKQLKAEGLIDAVGMQCHINILHCTADDIKRSFEEFSKLGLPIHVTEIDIGLPEMNDPAPLSSMTQEQREQQASLYEALFATMREYSSIIDSATVWGVRDSQSWLNNFRFERECTALLFDKDGQPTEAFYRITQF